MTSVVRSWRRLKSASISSIGSSAMLELTWLIERIIRVPGDPVWGGGDRGFDEKRQFTESRELVPWCKELYDACNDADRPIPEDQVLELLQKCA